MLELGVCYYPEQWPREKWPEDAARMVELGLDWVRIGEFSWSAVEPEPGQFDWSFMDEAIDVLGKAGLKVILGTPTAAPPKWLIDRHPDILAVGPDGHVRRFGARRHYCFSSRTYFREAARITRAFVERYGHHPFVRAWQTDNEYGDHDTIYSYSAEAERAFRLWLENRYGTIDALNEAWGTRFWSMRYRHFDEVDLPLHVVEEPSPTHLVDFVRFSSDQVVQFNRQQVEIIRAGSPGRPVTHNFMSHNIDFDHFKLSEDLDVASWDVYPMGGLINGRLPDEEKARLLRTGDPDQVAFNHDLYRAAGRGRVWVMEQQPGPVNWAAHNQAPADGMVRLWTWLAYAHGVDMVAYFRWRQAPFAQEQFHAGLLLPDSTPDQAFHETATVAAERERLPKNRQRERAKVALVMDYESRWASRALPQGRTYQASAICLDWYAALSRHGVDIDIVSQESDLEGYALVICPDLLIPNTGFIERLKASQAKVLFGPRSGSKTPDMHIPDGLPPGPLRDLIDIRVTRVESLPSPESETVLHGNRSFAAGTWRETIETGESVLATFTGAYRPGSPALVGNAGVRYLTALPSREWLDALMRDCLDWAGISWLPDLGDIRLARRGDLTFAFNFGTEAKELPIPANAGILVGESYLEPAGVTIWRHI
ncbi:beta-galactosidase [Gellertiella hungarica]|nr:beta-galactosidase [Gellertiella hungarica]